MANRHRRHLHRLLAPLVLLLTPGAAYAAMPAVEVLFILPLFCMVVVSVLGWFAARLLQGATARNFTRMLLLALLWTPVPVIALQNFGFGFMFSGIYLCLFLWSFLLTRGNPSAYLTPEIGQQHLAVAIAVGIVCVLGGVVLLARSLARLRQARRQRFGINAT